MYIRGYLLFAMLLILSCSSGAKDCLFYTIKNSEEWHFYNYIAAAYTQMNTQPSSENLYSFKEDPINLISSSMAGLVDTQPESLLILEDFFPVKNSNEYWVSLIQKTQDILKRYSLNNENGIQKIHDAATYGEDGPVLCPKGKLYSIDEALSMITDPKQQVTIQEKMAHDQRFIQVQEFRAAFQDTNYQGLLLGGEVELFSPRYFHLFRKFAEENLNSWGHVLSPLSRDEKEKLIDELNSDIKNEIRGTDVSIPELNQQTLFIGNKINFISIDTKILPDKFKWLILNKALEKVNVFRFIDSYMHFNNWKVVEDSSLLYGLYTITISKLELIHKRPYKNPAAYLENLVLTFNDDGSMGKQLLHPTKQLDNDFTHHVHVSYAQKDQAPNFCEEGKLLQDTVAILMLKFDENAFTTKNKFIRYKQNLKNDIQALVRIAPYKCINRIEFRRQFSGFKYDEFLKWLLSNVFIIDEKQRIDTIKNFNQQILKELNDMGKNYDEVTKANIDYIFIANSRK